MNDQILDAAFLCAQQAEQQDEVPVGAVVFDSHTNEIIASAYNLTERMQNPTAHAEVLAIQKACAVLGIKRLNGYSLYVTLEPCVMCAGAVSLAHLDALYFGTSDIKTGAVNQGACVFTHAQTHHKPQIIGPIDSERCGKILSHYFQNKRQLKKK